jgi:hypothetical protein
LLAIQEAAGVCGHAFCTGLDRTVGSNRQANNRSCQNNSVNCYGAVFVIAEVFYEFHHVGIPPKDFKICSSNPVSLFDPLSFRPARLGMTLYVPSRTIA